MNKRDFLKSVPLAAASPLALGEVELAKAPAMPLLATPKTPEQLFNAINSLFKNEGEFDTAYTLQRRNGWERHINFRSYFPDGYSRKVIR